MLFSDSTWIQGNVGIQPLFQGDPQAIQREAQEPVLGPWPRKNDLLAQVIPITVVDDIYRYYL